MRKRLPQRRIVKMEKQERRGKGKPFYRSAGFYAI
jgi:hypothetical protein